MISLKSWMKYLFPVVDGPVEDLQALVSEKKIVKAMKAGIVKTLSWKRMAMNMSEEMSS